MTAGADREGPAGARFRARSTAGILADRLAAELARHEPGWRLPRRTALARRHDVSLAQIDAAVAELERRHLVRRLPDRRLCRASPAEYLIPLPDAPGLGSRIGPRDGEMTCLSRQASWRRMPEDIGRALRAAPGERVYAVHAVWAAGGEPAVHATTYLAAGMTGQVPGPAAPGPAVPGAGHAADPPAAGRAGKPAGATPAGEVSEAAGARALPGSAAAGPGVPLPRAGTGAGAAAGQSLPSLTPCPELPAARWGDSAVLGRPASLQLELQPPPPSIARRLRLPAGQPALLVTARFDDPGTGRPAALTAAVLRPELLRVVVQTARPPLPDGGAGGPPAPPG